MSDSLFFILTLASALGAALMAGIYYAFSTMVMMGLRRLQPAQAIAAMQSINAAVMNPWFLLAFMGSAVLAVVSVIVSIVEWGDDGAVYVLVGGLLLLAGSLVLTTTYHIPRNNALMTITPNGADAPERWLRYDAEWSRLNHVRAGASLAATAFYIAAIAVH